MRDGQIIERQQNDARRIAMLYRQCQFVATRLEAYETVLSLRLAMLRAIFNPKWLQHSVDAIQLALMKAHDDTVRAAQEKSKEEAAKPKLTIVGANGVKLASVLFALLMLSGCVTRKYHVAKVAEAHKVGYNQADKECLALQVRIAKYVESLKERLRRYDQLDEKGNLKPLKTWTGDSWEDDVNPDAPWLK